MNCLLMNSVRLIKNVRIASSVFSIRYYTLHSKNKQILQYNKNQISRTGRSSYLEISQNPVKYISSYNSMQTKDSDPVGEKNERNKVRKILEDEDMQSILKDFSNDFGVDNETSELLDDIRKNIDKDHKNSCTSEIIQENSDLPSSNISRRIHKYKEFSDLDSKVIFSNEECSQKIEESIEESETFYHIDDELKPIMPYRELKRGVTGVFDLQEMVEVLQNESLLDITVISVPKELHYTDYLVLATAKSGRHSKAFAETLNKIYKQKKNKKDPFLIIEGEDVPDWKVIDMGNIVLHLFLDETRALYDIESLWLLESKYDSGGNVPPDPMLNIIEEQMEFFNSLQQPNSTKIPKDPS